MIVPASEEPMDSSGEAQESRLPPGEDTILRRVVLEPVGKPLWEYDTPATFIRALLGVVEGIDILSKHGIMHRNIAVGNVLLPVDPRPGFEAFLIDLDCAVYDPSERCRTDTDSPVSIVGGAGASEASVGATNTRTILDEIASEESHYAGPGPVMTGTVQFMSLNRLSYLRRYLDNRHDDMLPEFAHDTKDDLESMYWVAVYALYRREYQKNKTLEKYFKREFGTPTVADTYNARKEFLATVILKPTSTRALASSSSVWCMHKYFDSELADLVPLMAQLVAGQNVEVNDAPEVEADFQSILQGAREALYTTAAAVPMTCELTRALLLVYARKSVPYALHGLP